ncbi:hypothetical protein ACFC09_15360 [Streptomyces sp. NPDC056161]|uniref:hypothetical protein n=1 Tax=Streptomyces sp. NPDC056161 TaxID=3345732 RepID=UPI0035DB23DC
MAQSTDQNGSGAGPADRELVGRVLAAMADHFTAHRPDAVLTTDAVAVCASAEVYNATGRSVLLSASTLLGTVMNALPEAASRSTRRQYADVLRQEASAYGWSGEENERAVQAVPRPPVGGPGRSAPQSGPRPAPHHGE